MTRNNLSKNDMTKSKSKRKMLQEETESETDLTRHKTRKTSNHSINPEMPQSPSNKQQSVSPNSRHLHNYILPNPPQALPFQYPSSSDSATTTTNYSKLQPSQSNQVTNGFFSTSNEPMQEASARLLFMTIKWCKSLPSFAALPLRDQVRILSFAFY